MQSFPGFRIEKQIGTGAASTIYRAIDLATGAAVALKHVLRNGPEDDRFVEQVETEFTVGSRIEHPSLRKSLSIHRVKKLLQLREVILVMEYVDGLPLEVARPNRMDRFFSAFRKVALGLDALHSAGYLHGDMKPRNIVLGRGGTVKIIDFGQASPIGRRKERIQGTPDYIAPEQIAKKALTERTDVFNVGASMYWVLTSQNYPTELQLHGITSARKGTTFNDPEKPLAPIDWNDKIPRVVSNLVMECCRKDPAARPTSMKELVTRLDAAQRVWAKERRDRVAQLANRPAAQEDGAGQTSRG